MTESSDTPSGEPRNGLGTASLVIAIIALVASVSICGGVVLGASAALMGMAARQRVKRGLADNRRVATTGIVLGVAAIVIGLSMVVLSAQRCATSVSAASAHSRACSPFR